MNIRSNIASYLFDKEYLVCTYENFVYVLNYKYLVSYSDSRIVLKLEKKTALIFGISLSIVKITKEEMLIKGNIDKIEMKNE